MIHWERRAASTDATEGANRPGFGQRRNDRNRRGHDRLFQLPADVRYPVSLRIEEGGARVAAAGAAGVHDEPSTRLGPAR